MRHVRANDSPYHHFASAVAPDGSIFVAGGGPASVDGTEVEGSYFLRFSAAGELEVAVSLGPATISDIDVATDGTIGVAGQTGDSSGGSDVRNAFVAKLNPSGEILWRDEFEPSGHAMALDFGPGGDLAVLGTTYQQNTTPFTIDWVVRRYDGGGGLVFNTQQGSKNEVEQAHDVELDGQGNIYALVRDEREYPQARVVKLDPAGVVVWSVPVDEVDYGLGAIGVGDDGNVVWAGAGETTKDVELRRFDAEGTVVETISVLATDDLDAATGLAVNSNGDIALTGYAASVPDFSGGDRYYDVFVALVEGSKARSRIYRQPKNNRGAQEGRSIAFHPSGDLIVSGRFERALAWKSALVADGRDVFVARVPRP